MSRREGSISKNDDVGGERSPGGDVEDKEEMRVAAAAGEDDEAGTRQPYNCTFCRRGFPTAQALGGHMNVHRRDRVGRATPSSSSTAAAATAATRRSVSCDTLVGLFSSGRTRPPASGGEEATTSTAAAGRTPQELRLFGSDDGRAGRHEEGGVVRDRDRYGLCSKDGGDGNGGHDQGDEELDLELRLGGSSGS